MIDIILMRVSFTSEKQRIAAKGIAMKQYVLIGGKDFQGNGYMEIVLAYVNCSKTGNTSLSMPDRLTSVVSYNTQDSGLAHQLTIIGVRKAVKRYIEFTQLEDDSWVYEQGTALEVSELGKVTRKAFTSKGPVVYNGVRLDHLYRYLVIGKRQ
jgi:hypothetical protein